MFGMGHVGCTLGIVVIIAMMVPELRDRIDLRFVLVGALLPDLIDKPIGHIIFASSIGYGRLLGHTLLFVLLLAVIGLFLHGKNRDNAICLSFATFLHLIEDRMWEIPKVLFYPVYGFDLPSRTVAYEHWYDYFATMAVDSYTPSLSYVFVSEIVGICVIVVLCIMFAGNLIKDRKTRHRV
ncbi:MAG: metal-dependent hydrolase [Candidatus Methanogaster sp.]|uniref:Metal-dependent hydrolase n=1 Tax=Candidatus Methanogaster sp. TaxID=3386292 RepID=A0AC61KZL1_9EURY|nr:MAG: metal-dependent hydrolase [ANME-2 cluster archaeon]